MVGLGPPLEREEPLLAGMTAYLEEEPESAGGEQRTLVGFPPAPVPLEDETAAEPEETPNDAITAVASYEEITVVTKAPVAVHALAVIADSCALLLRHAQGA